MTSEFVHRKRYEEMTGVSHNVVSNWMKRWERNKHYVVLGKQTMINLNEVNAWIKTSGLNTFTMTKELSE